MKFEVLPYKTTDKLVGPLDEPDEAARAKWAKWQGGQQPSMLQTCRGDRGSPRVWPREFTPSCGAHTWRRQGMFARDPLFKKKPPYALQYSKGLLRRIVNPRPLGHRRPRDPSPVTRTAGLPPRSTWQLSRDARPHCPGEPQAPQDDIGT